MSKVIELINENKAKEVIEVIDLPNSLLSKIMLEKYNEYSVLNEEEKFLGYWLNQLMIKGGLR
jgi:hypothetical protein